MEFGQYDSLSQKPIIKVLGVGGGGGNAINRMISNDVKGVQFVAVNTDVQDLRDSKAEIKIAIGSKLTKGRGAGADPQIGRQAAIESEQELRKELTGVDLVFITAGMGGGTGTGAAPIIAKIAKELGCLTLAFVTKPFFFEGTKRTQMALEGLENLKEHCDSLIIVPNEKLISLVDPATTMMSAFREADQVLRQGVQGVAEIITYAGMINVDFADVRTVMANKGTALMGIGAAKGEYRAVEAARRAIQSNLLDISLDGATDAIVNITSGESLTLLEANSAIEEIRNACSDDLNLIFGTTLNRKLQDELIITVIATGYDLKAKQNGIENLSSKIISGEKVEFSKPLASFDQVKQVETPRTNALDNAFKQPENKSTTNIPDWLRNKSK